jgi:Protein of unknown function (DUF1488)
MWGAAMLLATASGQTVFRPDGVRFLMKDGPDEVVCTISNRALSALGDTVGMNDTTLIFWAYRDEIERAASAKYDRTAREQYEILDIKARDL